MAQLPLSFLQNFCSVHARGRPKLAGHQTMRSRHTQPAKTHEVLKRSAHSTLNRTGNDAKTAVWATDVTQTGLSSHPSKKGVAGRQMDVFKSISPRLLHSSSQFLKGILRIEAECSVRSTKYPACRQLQQQINRASEKQVFGNLAYGRKTPSVTAGRPRSLVPLRSRVNGRNQSSPIVEAPTSLIDRFPWGTQEPGINNNFYQPCALKTLSARQAKRGSFIDKGALVPIRLDVNNVALRLAHRMAAVKQLLLVFLP